MIDQFSTAVNPTKFETGNGTFVSDSCISLDGSSFGKASYHVMNDCPLVRSLGKIVQEDDKPFVWVPGELPFFGKSKDVVQIAADESQIIQANRVEDGVPIFVEDVNVSRQTYALAAGDGEIVDEPPAPHPVAPLVEGDRRLSDADSEDGDEDPLPRAQRLQAEARSLQHRMCHIPKNPCQICRRSRMYRRRLQVPFGKNKHSTVALAGAFGWSLSPFFSLSPFPFPLPFPFSASAPWHHLPSPWPLAFLYPTKQPSKLCSFRRLVLKWYSIQDILYLLDKCFQTIVREIFTLQFKKGLLSEISTSLHIQSELLRQQPNHESALWTSSCHLTSLNVALIRHSDFWFQMLSVS